MFLKVHKTFKVKIQNVGIFLGLLKFQIFFLCV